MERYRASLDALARHYAAMPPVAAMRPEVAGFAEGRLRLRAPLAANVNDKGCAFGGSLTSLMTIAGWGLVFLPVDAAGAEADIFIADSRVRFLKPVYEELVVEARLDDPAHAATLVDTLRRQGRTSLRVQAQSLLADGGIAATFVGRYVAIARDAR